MLKFNKIKQMNLKKICSNYFKFKVKRTLPMEKKLKSIDLLKDELEGEKGK